MPVVEISVRLSPGGRENLNRLCLEHSISVRAAFEGAALCALTVCEKKRRSRIEDAFMDAMIAAVHRLIADEEQRTEKVNARMESEILDRLRTQAEAHNASISACLAALFMPWGSGWAAAEPGLYDFRAELWERAVKTAQRLDYDRRMKRPPPGS